MSSPLITTKFFIPPAPPNNLPRQRLFDLLNQALAEGRRVALVCAPAGYGKTTLAAAWVRALRQASTAAAPVRAAWLSLDEGENDPRQFLLYLISSLQRAIPEKAEEIDLLLQAVSSGASETVLAGIVNMLSELSGSTLLVLDDYQAIHTPAVHNAAVFLCEHLPPNAQMLVTSRSDPPFPLHRYRARGQVVEVRMEPLRLTQPEVERLLAQENERGAALPGLGPVESELLTERTEGWPAGVQMALLSLRGKANPQEFIHSWTGSQRFILDYLGEEVFNNQPPAVQRFLVRTAILGRFCAPLCDALLNSRPEEEASSTEEEASSTEEEASSTEEETTSTEEIIARLEHENLFLIPLDEEAASGDSGAGWFRFHHLFLDLLRVRLKHAGQKEPGLVETLHHRAAVWMEANGWPREAIQHSIQAGDYNAAARLVEQHTLRLFSEGELHALVSWVRLLPADLADSRPWLRIYQAWALAFAGELTRARQLIEPLEEMTAPAEDVSEEDGSENAPAPEERRRIQAELAGIRAMTATMSGQIGEVLAMQGLPADTFPESSLFAKSALHWALGYAWRMQGDLPKAIAEFTTMQQIGLQTNNTWTILSAAVDLGLVLRLTGRLRQAEAVYRDGLRRVEQAGARGAGFVGRLESFLANTLYDKNELEEARQLALSSIHHNRYWDNPNHTTHAYAVLARIRLGQQDLPGALAALDEAEKTAREHTVVPPLHAMLASLRVRAWLAGNDLSQAAGWLESQQPSISNLAFLRTEMGETLGIAMARMRLALGDAAGARALLDSLEQSARAGSHINALIEIRALAALAAPGPATARDALLESLSLGCPEGYTRVFLDEGAALRKGIEESLAALKPAHPLAGCMRSLLDQFPRPPAPASNPPESPLTARELDILRAIAEGLSNLEIGRRLYISTGTVKAHSAAIYRKLDVANRTEAIAKAKDMGWV